VEGGAQRTVTFSRADALGAEGQRFLLRPSDAIFVPEMANFRVQRFATIEGQVARPGTYPIRPDTTTVRDLVAMAGGLTPLASLPLATLRRQPVPITRAEEQLQKLPPDLLGNEERGIMEARAVTDVSIVSLDLRTLVAEGRNAFDQTLRAHDVLTIPERRDEVTVAGAVIRPGILTYVEGQSARDYVVRAGWVSRRADAGGTVVIRAQSGARISANEAHTVDPGDTIVVPFRRRRDLAATVQIVTGVASTILGLALTAVALF
jgi:protein involved in polysaccharide export with SLBB domain